jgi:dTDP-glucose 4,6-dehydratase
MPDRYLLTGASGFVGSHALRHLLATTDAEIVCPVTFRHRGIADRIRLSLDGMPDAAGRVTVIRTDLSAPISRVTDAAFGHIDYVLNFASESHVDRSIEEPAAFIQANVALITNVLDWVRRRETFDPITAMVQVSTDEVYGPAEAGHAHREWEDQHLPSNPYSASKAAQEDALFAYWRTYDLPLIITNTMNIVGEMQDPEKFVPMTLARILAGQPMTIHASAEGQPGSRFYLHARNQADGVLHVLQYAVGGSLRQNTRGESLRHSHGGIRPYRFNIVGEREVDNLQMAQLVAAAAGRDLDYELVDFHSSRPGHDLRYALDGTKLAETGWTPPVPLDESVKRLVAWTLDHPEWLR